MGTRAVGVGMRRGLRTPAAAAAIAALLCVLGTACGGGTAADAPPLCRVTVVDSSGQPVANAKVRQLLTTTWRAAVASAQPPNARPPSSTWAATDRLGVLFLTDSEGNVDVDSSPSFLSATSGARYGTATVGQRSNKATTITLEPDWHLRVRVHDPRGAAAAGIPLTVRAGDRNWAGTTDQGGIAAVAHLQEMHPVPMTLEVTVGIPGVDAAATVEVGADPGGSTTQLNADLTLPGMGSVTVLVCNPTGQPVRNKPIQLELLGQPAKSVDPARSKSRASRLWATTLTDIDGVASFPLVPVALTLRARIEDSRITSEPIQGPLRHGESISVTLQTDS